ncbi:MAG TPA: hypothetical protein VHA35_09115 [Dongiaceae bacterium]|nr:hypothetical protein [Dongiaceae bacterium]
MPRLITTMTVLAAAALLAACAQKKEDPAAPAAMAPEPAPAMMENPTEAAKPIALDKAVMPDGGTLESGTLVTGKDGWAVHGEKDGVAWRYGSSDHGYLRVSQNEGLEWRFIQVAESWSVLCKAEAATDGGAAKTFCDVLHTQPVTPNTMTTGGIRVADHGVCAVTDNTTDAATVTVDGGAPHSLAAPDHCEAGDALGNELLAGKSVTLSAVFGAKGQPQSITFPTTGLKQALAMRDWIVDKYKSGDLSAE